MRGEGVVVLALIVGLIMSVVVARAAHDRGQGWVGWWIYGLFLWPVALVHILVTPKTAEKTLADRQGLAVREGRVPCPFCAEMILPAAKLCPHCRSDLQQQQPATP